MLKQNVLGWEDRRADTSAALETAAYMSVKRGQKGELTGKMRPVKDQEAPPACFPKTKEEKRQTSHSVKKQIEETPQHHGLGIRNGLNATERKLKLNHGLDGKGP